MLNIILLATLCIGGTTLLDIYHEKTKFREIDFSKLTAEERSLI